jgi:hypothetical protein
MILPFNIYSFPEVGPNSFGANRKHDIHTGIDLFCAERQPIYAMEDGIVVNILPFTGPKADSPWWNDTNAVMVEGKSGVILYGELTPNPKLKIGDSIKQRTLIGRIVKVLKKDKKLPASMLHLELYVPGTTEPVWWHHNQEQPKELLNPNSLMTAALNEIKKDVTYFNEMIGPIIRNENSLVYLPEDDIFVKNIYYDVCLDYKKSTAYQTKVKYIITIRGKKNENDNFILNLLHITIRHPNWKIAEESENHE